MESTFSFSQVYRMSQFEMFVASATTAERLTEIKQAVSHAGKDHPLHQGTDGFCNLHALVNKRGRELNLACYTWGFRNLVPQPDARLDNLNAALARKAQWKADHAVLMQAREIKSNLPVGPDPVM